MDFLIGRQQIFDRNLALFGYELLFRPVGNSADADGSAITQQLVADAILELGLERLTGGALAFINFTSANLLSGMTEALPKDKVVIEILESAEITPALIAQVSRLVASGYRIALDDFSFEPQWEPLVKIAHIVKIDVRARAEHATLKLIEQLKPYGVKILLEKIESEQEFKLYHRLGGEYFQGYFLHRPEVQAGKRLSPSTQTLLELLSKLHSPSLSLPEIAQILRRDPVLSLKLLNFINSACFALASRIDSVEHAVILLGIEQIKRWATLIALGGSASIPSAELLKTALIRARMCELIAIATHYPDPNQAFLVGLFSNLDALLKAPLPEVLKLLPLAEEIRAGILSQGRLGEMLRWVLSYEAFNLPAIEGLELSPATLGQIYLDSIAYVHQVYKGL
jgi:EAL and modified HD-GYP domain-containing signal transduction protein